MGVQTTVYQTKSSMAISALSRQNWSDRRELVTYRQAQPADAVVQAHQVQQHTDSGSEEEHLDVSEPELQGVQVFYRLDVVPDLERDAGRALFDVLSHR